jgi:YD repeat-containing protein
VRGQLSEIRESASYSGATDTSWDRGAIINHYSNGYGCWGASCNAADNNGNLMKQEVYIPNNDPMTSYTTWLQQYDYDTLNRLQRVHEYTGNTALDWQQEHVYDRYGNRTIDGNSAKTFGNGINSAQMSVSTFTNRMYGPGETDASHTQVDYDAAGNQTKDLTAASGGGTRVYDAENRMTSAGSAGVTPATYAYNGDGQRVRRSVSGVETWQVYGIGGELLTEYAANASPATPQKEYGYRNGQLLITAESGSSSANAATICKLTAARRAVGKECTVAAVTALLTTPPAILPMRRFR